MHAYKCYLKDFSEWALCLCIGETDLKGSGHCPYDLIQSQLLPLSALSKYSPTAGVKASMWLGWVGVGRTPHSVHNEMHALKKGENRGCLCLYSRKTEVFLIAFRVKCLLLKRIEPLSNSDKGRKSHRNQRPKPKFQWISWELESHQGPRLLSVYSLWGRFFIWCCRLGRQWKTSLTQLLSMKLAVHL